MSNLLDLSDIPGVLGGVLTEHYIKYFTQVPKTMPRGVINSFEQEGNSLAFVSGESEKKTTLDRRFWIYTLKGRILTLTWERLTGKEFACFPKPPIYQYTIYLKQ